MRVSLLVALTLLSVSPCLHAQDADAEREQQLKTAVTKGVRWLLTQQQADGHWTYDNAPLEISAYPMHQGSTALGAFTLLKCGIGPEEEPVAKAFEYIHAQKLRFTYSVGCVLLALEAKINYDPERQVAANPMVTRVRKKDQKAKGKDKKLAEDCVAWLQGNQGPTGLWRYYGIGGEDMSNAQYAMLGLDAAERMGVKVPQEIYEKAAARLLATQHKGTQKVEPFPVPGADSSYKDLRKVEAKMIKELRKIEKKFKKLEEGEADKDGKTKDDHLHSVTRKATEDMLESMSRGAMVARGWSYMSPELSKRESQIKVNGSMTCSALASLFICKSRLEGSRGYKALEEPMIQALRDGSAWMAKNFSAKRNPESPHHKYYYLYGLERAGILGLVERFGEHDWFEEGAHYLLRNQKPDGRWDAGMGGTSGPMPDTCFALLFLARGTTPVVQLPRRVATGGGKVYGGGR